MARHCIPQKPTHQIAITALRSAAPASGGLGPDRCGRVPSLAIAVSSASTSSTKARYHVAAATTAEFAAEARRFTILIFVVSGESRHGRAACGQCITQQARELAGMVGQLEQQLTRQRTNLAHLDATMRLFDPEIRPQEIRAKQRRARSAWFRQGECLRRIYDELRNAAHPLTTRDLAERIMRAKAVPADDDRSRELIQKTVLGSLNRAKETIARVEAAGVVSWRLV